MTDIPMAKWAGRARVLPLVTLCFVVGLVWGLHHLMSVIAALTGRGNPLAFTWFVAFAMLWWVALAWFEKPYKVTPRQRAKLDELVVTVQVPVFNEDVAALRKCLESLFHQTRLPDRIRVVDDGSTYQTAVDYLAVQRYFLSEAYRLGIYATWDRTVNRGKRWAQMHVLANDPGDIFVTLDSDSVLERRAIEEGLKPFADSEVMSVAGMVAVWNSRQNFLTMLTCILYNAFTRGFRSAQSVMGRVMVNSGTLAFYRGHVIREITGVYENEAFMGRPMQMNDDSFMTFAAMLKGRTVHQPNSVAFTLAPDKFKHYFNQQLRWMRGTNVRTAWWVRYLSPRDFAWWMPLIELVSFFLSFVILGRLIFDDSIITPDPWQLVWTTALVGVFMSYIIGLRYFILKRSDESIWFQLAVFALAPVASVWRLVFLRPLMLYAMLTFWKVGNWGTRTAGVEVGLAKAAG